MAKLPEFLQDLVDAGWSPEQPSAECRAAIAPLLESNLEPEDARGVHWIFIGLTLTVRFGRRTNLRESMVRLAAAALLLVSEGHEPSRENVRELIGKLRSWERDVYGPALQRMEEADELKVEDRATYEPALTAQELANVVVAICLYRYTTIVGEMSSGEREAQGLSGQVQDLAKPLAHLITEQDLAGLVVAEKGAIIQLKFIVSGRFKDRRDDLDKMEVAACDISMIVNPGILVQAGWMEPGAVHSDQEALGRVLKRNAEWLQSVAMPAIDKSRERGDQDPSWGARLLRDSRAPDCRDSAITALYMGSLQRQRIYFTPEESLRALRTAVRKHEAYKPSDFKEKEKTLIANQRDASCWSQLIVEERGFEDAMYINSQGRIGLGWTEAKNALDSFFGHFQQHKAEPGRVEAPPDEEAEFLDSLTRSREPRPATASVLSELRDVVQDHRWAVGLLDRILDSLDFLADRGNDAAAEVCAAEAIRLVTLIESVADRGLRAAIFYAWGRAQSGEGIWSRKECAEAFDTSVSTMQRRSQDGRKMLKGSDLGES